MSFSVVEIDDFEVSVEGETAELQKNEVFKSPFLNISNPTLLKYDYPDIGIFGYFFKGPENFKDTPKSADLNTEIMNYVDQTYRCSYGDPNISKRPISNSLGNTAGLKEMCKLPIKFTNPSLEVLYTLNLNEWMIGRFPFIALIYLVLTIVFWPITTLDFEKSSPWLGFSFVYIMFHVLMVLTIVLILIPLICIWKRFAFFQETTCYWSLGLISFLWGSWNIAATISSSGSTNEEFLIRLICARQTLRGLTCIYAMLPIIALDSFLPTRTSKTWPIHLQFIILYSTSTFMKVAFDSYRIPWIYIIFRITGYTSVIILVYFGSYNSETQIRISFYNWLTSSRKIARLENDILRNQIPDKPYTPAEVIISNVKTCLKIAHVVRDAINDRIPEMSLPIDHMYSAMKTCLNQMTTNKGLYALSPKQIYKNLGNEAEIIDSYINSYHKPEKIHKPLSFDSSTTKYQEPLSFSLDHDKRFASYIRPVPDFQCSVKLDRLLNDWNFDFFKFFKEDPNPFVSMGYSLLSEFASRFQIPQNIILNFLTVVEGLYNNVPYHNCIHGAFVAQKMCCLSNYIGLYKKMSVLDRAIMVVSAICHDVGHPGKTNSFLVNSGHEVAHLFNDTSVLENFHCCLTFNILRVKECNIFSFLGKQEMRQVRRRIIELILATDMENHFEFISSFRVRRLSNNFSIENDLLNICKILIKASDLASSSISWEMSCEWVQRLSSEFYSQGELEKTMELPVSPLCDPNRHIDLPKAQSGFLLLVVSPLYEEISKIPYSDKCNSEKDDHVTISLSDLKKISGSLSFVDISPKPSDEQTQNEYKRSSGGKSAKNSCYYDELISGDMNDWSEQDVCQICSDEFNQIYQTPTNRVVSVCLEQLRNNSREWKRLSELGITIFFDEFNQEDVSLDIQLAIQT